MKTKALINNKTLRLVNDIITLLRGSFPRKSRTRASWMRLGSFTLGAGVVFRFLKYMASSGKPKLRFKHELAEGEGLLITHKKAN